MAGLAFPSEQRYHSQSAAFYREFGKKMVKVPLSTGFGCPNRDGRRGVGGCTFCSGAGSGDFAGRPGQPLAVQWEQAARPLLEKWPQ